MNTEFEKHAREQFEGQEVEVDTDALWANVYPHVKKEKGNRRIFWFFLLGLLVGVTAFGLYNFSQKDSAEGNASISSSSETKTKTGTASKDLGKTESDKQTSDLSFNKTNQSNDKSSNSLTNTENEKSVSNSSQSDNNNERKTTQASSPTKTPKLTSKNTTPAIVDEPIATQPSPISTNINTNFTNNKTPNNSLNRDVSLPTKTSIDISADQSEDTNISVTKNATSIPSKTIDSDVDKNLVAKAYKEQTNKLLLELSTPILANAATENELQILESQQEKAEDKNEKEIKRLKRAAKKMNFGFGIYGGISQSNRRFPFPSDDSLGVIAYEKRNASEKRLEVLHFGIDLSLYYKQNWYLRSGAEYSRIASIFSTNTKQVTIDSTIGPTQIIINEITGQKDTVTGIIETTTTTEFKKKTYNNIHLLDIPVIFGYQFEYDRWSGGIEGGVYANVLTKFTGEIADPSNDSYYDLETDENKWFKSNVGLQPYIGFNASYRLSNNLLIHFSPGFRFQTIYSTDKNPLIEKHSNLGIRAGIRYVFD